MQRQREIAWRQTFGIVLGCMLWASQWPVAAAAQETAQTKPSSSATTKVAVQTSPSGGAAPAATPTAQAGLPAEASAKAGNGKEKIVHTFEDAAKMEEFAKLWQQRQGILVRMSVLQAYWNEEQTLLDQLNHTLSGQYALDVSKSYYLDGTRRVLIEQETPPVPPATPSTPSQSTPAPKP